MCHGGGRGAGRWKGFSFSIAMKIYGKIWNKKTGLSHKHSSQHDFVAGTRNKR